MRKIHTHYDNLKVARNAPIEVIRAAYKSLSHKYHPDKNGGDPESAKIMTIINASYEVLSDPSQRREHDFWIAEKEALDKRTQSNTTSITKEAGSVKPFLEKSFSQKYLNTSTLSNAIFFIFKYWYVFFLLFIFAITGFEQKEQTPIISKPYTSEPTDNEMVDEPPAITDVMQYERSLTAPNGKPWPKLAGYVDGLRKLNTKGLSNVTVDNSKNNTDVFVKLVYLDGQEAYPVRQFFIPAGSKFTVNRISAGNYDIRYRNLDTGRLSKSESFELVEKELEDGTQFSKYTMTLYKVDYGNMKTYPLQESEF